MKNYSIVRVGNEYIVQANDKSVLKIASRRKAARLITDAAELLEAQAAPQPSAQTHTGSSITRDPRVIPDPRVTPDPGIIPDPPEVP
jgi:hypothetical protein